ncbi:magnesium transporter MgtE N-terminal domain-containing protein [Evansella sp. AB-rgal1]|uniref:magnesium transporter MgtE N-terminal domain-containing protein n=1 Tax=Evansella sp. AB-rgal1 TaxID=3242696 RepID=UPI00359DCBB2
MRKKKGFVNREELTYYLFLYLKNKDKDNFRKDFLELHPTDQAEIYNQFSEEKRKQVYTYLAPTEFAEIFQGLELKEQKTVFAELDDFAIGILNDLPADEATDFFGQIPDHIAAYLLNKMDKTEADNIKLLLSYKENTAGSLMTTEFITLKSNETVSDVMERLRIAGTDAETIYYLYVINDEDKLIGVVSLRRTASLPPLLFLYQIPTYLEHKTRILRMNSKKLS